MWNENGVEWKQKTQNCIKLISLINYSKVSIRFECEASATFGNVKSYRALGSKQM